MISIVLAAALAQGSAAPDLQERTVMVTVVDDKGNPVQGLTAQDVAVEERGVTRELVRLDPDARPLRVAVLVDTSQTLASSYRLYVVDAVLQLLLRLPEGSQYALWTTGDRPVKVYGYGNDRAAAARAMKRVMPQGGNLLFDALVEASRDLGDKEGTRGAIVVVTGLGIGFANYHREQVLDALEDHDHAVLAVTIEEGRQAPERPGFGNDDRLGAMDYEYVLSSAARRTGGVRDALLSPMGLEDALRRMGGELNGRYRLTYRGAAGDKDPKLAVTVARPGAKVRVGGAIR